MCFESLILIPLGFIGYLSIVVKVVKLTTLIERFKTFLMGCCGPFIFYKQDLAGRLKHLI